MDGELVRGDSAEERAAKIEELRHDLDNALAYRERMQEPPTSKEVAMRAMDRLWQGNGAYGLFMLVIVSLGAAFIWAPYDFPIYLTPLIVLAPFFVFAFLREKYSGERSSRIWRDAQIAEIDVDIAGIQRELIRMGASEPDEAPIGETPAAGIVSGPERLH